ncbi:MAG: NAD(P)H-dependent oxidoreductase [Streptosporangiaceae bacterium]
MAAALAREVARVLGAGEVTQIDLALFGPRVLDPADAQVTAAAEEILGADVLIVASPTYKATYSGLPAVCARPRPPRPGRQACPRCRPPATPALAGSPAGPTASGSSATCTAPAPSWPAPRAARPSTSRPCSPTWSPATAVPPLTCLA